MQSRLKMRRSVAIMTIAAGLLIMPGQRIGAVQSRVKDVARIVGLDDIELIGYGVVVGLGDSGDRDLELTRQTMANLLDRFQITLDRDDISGQNVAAVMVTARVAPFHHRGDRVDVAVMSVGDASSLAGGTLLMTPLVTAEGEVYALAQGALAVGGFSVGVDAPGGHQLTRNTPTAGRVPAGASLRFDDHRAWARDGILTLSLRHPDFTTAARMAKALNQSWPGSSVARDAATVKIRIPEALYQRGQTAAFVADVENTRVATAMRARLLLNERTGTIVMGGDIHVHPAVVAHGNLTVSVKSSLAVSQPEAPLTQGVTVVTEDVQAGAVVDDARIMMVPEIVTVQQLADTLNQMGGTTQDLVSILQALRRLGAIQVEIETM